MVQRVYRQIKNVDADVLHIDKEESVVVCPVTPMWMMIIFKH